MKYNINDLKIIVNDKILDDIRKYYCLNTNYETGGILLGKFNKENRVVEITEVHELKTNFFSRIFRMSFFLSVILLIIATAFTFFVSFIYSGKNFIILITRNNSLFLPRHFIYFFAPIKSCNIGKFYLSPSNGSILIYLAIYRRKFCSLKSYLPDGISHFSSPEI